MWCARVCGIALLVQLTVSLPEQLPSMLTPSMLTHAPSHAPTYAPTYAPTHASTHAPSATSLGSVKGLPAIAAEDEQDMGHHSARKLQDSQYSYELDALDVTFSYGRDDSSFSYGVGLYSYGNYGDGSPTSAPTLPFVSSTIYLTIGGMAGCDNCKCTSASSGMILLVPAERRDLTYFLSWCVLLLLHNDQTTATLRLSWCSP